MTVAARLPVLSAWYADLAAYATLTALASVYGERVPASHAWAKAAVTLADVSESAGVAPQAFGREPRDVVIEARAYARPSASATARLSALTVARVLDTRLTGPVPAGVAAALLADGLRVLGTGRLVLARSEPGPTDPDDPERGEIVRVRFTTAPA